MEVRSRGAIRIWREPAGRLATVAVGDSGSGVENFLRADPARNGGLALLVQTIVMINSS